MDKTFYHYEPEFDCPTERKLILAPPPDAHLLHQINPSTPKKIFIVIKNLHFYNVLSGQQERHLFRSLNCAKYLMNKYSDNKDKKYRYYKKAKETRNTIVTHNLKLVVSVCSQVKRLCDHIPIMELVSEGNFILLRVIDLFDYRLGYKLSTYATWAMRNTLGRFIHNSKEKLSMHSGDHYVELSHVTDYRRRADACELVKEDFKKLKQIIEKGDINDRSKTILKMRLGLKDGRYWSVEEISSVYGKTQTAIRNDFNKSCLHLFGQIIPNDVFSDLRRCYGSNNNRKN